MDQAHIDRVEAEMRQVGVTAYGMRKSESKYLPGLIQPDEHIGGIVYGLVSWLDSAMLVATDQRVIFLDKKLLFSNTDVIAYSAISGVNRARVGLFSSVILHTRMGDYEFRYVNGNCALTFVKYIQSQRLQAVVGPGKPAEDSSDEPAATPVFTNLADERSLEFLKSHDQAVLSTVNAKGAPSGALVYYQVDKDNLIYILTKAETSKARNILNKSPVALTVHEPGTLKTLQIQGDGQLENDQKVAESVYTQIVRTRPASSKAAPLPVAKLSAGMFTVIKITPTKLSFSDYSK